MAHPAKLAYGHECIIHDDSTWMPIDTQAHKYNCETETKTDSINYGPVIVCFPDRWHLAAPNYSRSEVYQQLGAD